MAKTNKGRLRRLVGLAAKSFIIASCIAVILPMPQYARSLSSAEYIIWLARLYWVLSLSIGVFAILLAAGYLARRLQNKTRKDG